MAVGACVGIGVGVAVAAGVGVAAAVGVAVAVGRAVDAESEAGSSLPEVAFGVLSNSPVQAMKSRAINTGK